MKKLLLGTILASTAVPVFAGPILDSMTPKGMTWTAEGEDVSGAGETYTGLVFTRGNWTAEVAEMTISEKANLTSLMMADGKMAKSNGDMTSFEGINLTFDRAVFNDLFETLQAGPTIITPEVCAKFDAPFDMSAEALSIDAAGSTLSIESLSGRYDVVAPDENCIVDMELAISGFSGVEKNGASTKFASIKLSAFSPMRADHPVTDLSRDFEADLAITDLVFGYGGAEQARIDSITSSSFVDVKSMAALAGSGYHELAGDLIRAEGDVNNINFSKFSLPKIWNALRETKAEGAFKIAGAEITGQMAQMVTGSELLAQGRDLNFLTVYQKASENIHFGLDIESSDLLHSELELHLVMDGMDEGLASSGPSALMMTMPISIAAAKLTLDDQGIGAYARSEFGLDHYSLIGPMVSSNLGPTKGEMVASWFEAVRNGGASVSIAPEAPLSLGMVFAGFMGDWAAFGEMMNVTVKPEL